MSNTPLTTTFTPPAACTSITRGYYFYDNIYHESLPSVTTGNVDVEFYMSLGPSDWNTCFPSGYATIDYFSPGFCPYGYSAAGATGKSSGNGIISDATCCPNGYTVQTGSDLAWYTSDQCGSVNFDSPTWTVKVGEAVKSASGPYGVNARGISIRWQEADFTTASSTITTTMDPKKAEFGSGLSPISGLSTGAKAGVGVGVGIGVSLLLSVTYAVYLLRKKTNSKNNISHENSKHLLPELSALQSDYHPEGDAGQKILHEMPQSQNLNPDPPQEMSTHRQ